MQAGTRAAAALVLAVALALTGCAGGTSVAGDPAAPPQTSESPTPTASPTLTSPLVPPSAAEVLAYCPASEASHLGAIRSGDGPPVVDVFVCTVEQFEQTVEPDGTELVPGDDAAGRSPVQRASRVTAGVDELLKAYARPNEPVADGPCIELAADPLIVWVRTSESTQAVYAPVDGCGLPTAAASEAYDAAELETVVEVQK